MRRRGPATEPQLITQDVPKQIPGADIVGDEFGFAVDAGYLDGDDFADMVVGVPGELGGSGSVVVIRGGRAGYALTGSTEVDRTWPGVPGEPVPNEELGWSLAIVRLPGDDRPDLVARLQAAVASALDQKETLDKLAGVGCEPFKGTSAQLAALVQSDLPKWARVVKETGAQVD